MTDTLIVVLEGARLSASDQEELNRQFQSAALRVEPQSVVTSTRLVVRHEKVGAMLEPFLGSASFMALMGIPKKRAKVLGLLQVLVQSAFRFSTDVSVVVDREDSAVPEREVEVTTEELLTLKKLRPGTRLRIRPMPVDGE